MIGPADFVWFPSKWTGVEAAGPLLAFLTICVLVLISGTIYYCRDSVMPGFIPAAHSGFPWETAPPESQGLDTAKLDSMWSTLRARNTVAFLVIPSLNLIVVRYGESLDSGNFGLALENHFFAPMMSTIIRPKTTKTPANHVRTTAPREGIAPYPASSIIKAIPWAPVSDIIRRAQGSDNWAVTWMDDNTLFTAYGDGWGFDPKVPEKMSLGFAVISGGPPVFSGVNAGVILLQGGIRDLRCP